MNIKSLLLGSAVAAVAATGARAADAIVIAEPEPMEYVRICDVYGAGFFYIPGTQNCLKIGGYVRYQMTYDSRNWTQVSGSIAAGFTTQDHSYRFSKLARFAPTFDVRSETEWGTLRAFAEVEFDWNSYTWGNYTVGPVSISPANVGLTTQAFGLGAAQTVNLNHAYIELIQSMGTLRIGKGDNPWARFTGYGAGGIYAGIYAHGGGFANSGEVSYTFNTGSGFSGVIAVIERATGRFDPNVEGGVMFSQGWGSIAGMVGYDNPANVWGAKGVLRVNFAPFSAGLHVFYSSTTGANWYGTPNPNGGTSRWSVLGHARVAASDKLDVKGHFQWYGASAAPATWEAGGGLVVKPFSNNSLEILPEVRYVNRNAAAGGSYWNMALRFNRNF